MVEQITPLRQRMIDDMTIRNMAPGTKAGYVRAVKNFALHFKRSPDKLTFDNVREYRLHLVSRSLEPQTINQIMCALRFFYGTTLGMADAAAQIPLARRSDPLPAILSRDEVARFLKAIANLKRRTAFATVYAAGLRVSEVVTLTPRDIDSSNMVIHVRQGKGRKDRYVMLSDQLLDLLRDYWKKERPPHWLFPELPFPPGSPFDRFFKRFGMPNNGRGGHEVITGQGSGFFITADGYAVTNNHVVQNAENVQVMTDDGKMYSAKVIGTDQRTDVALIKVEGNDFPYVKLADHTPRVGDWVLAVGNSFGLGGTVTAGIVSARGRDIGAGPYDDFIQIDAPVNKGNSGGPTFDVDGNVIGVDTRDLLAFGRFGRHRLRHSRRHGEQHCRPVA